jgi:predicted glutamine amidotransferase
MDELLYQPRNSLIRQSVAAHESEEPLNGDGFGVGWYSHHLGTDPGLFVSVRPAWNDRNLRYLSQKIQSSCIFAHVRAASLGEVSEANCHPFHYKNYLFMHNGGIEGFHYIKRYLRRGLSDEIYDWIRGQTDSEHLFALFLENMRGLGAKMGEEALGAEAMAEALEASVRTVREIKDQHEIAEDDYVNVAVSDGKRIVALRYASNPKERAPTLYYAHGAKYECRDGVAKMTPAHASEHAVLIVSEKLTTDRKQWKEIPENHLDRRGRPRDDGPVLSRARPERKR